MDVKNKNILDKFFNKQREKVAEKQQHVVVDAIQFLFSHAPHFENYQPPSQFAEGEYDVNNVVTLSGKVKHVTTEHTPPTYDKMKSHLENIKAMLVIDKIKCGTKATIHNITDHDEDVEYGPLVNPRWKRPGYRPYEKAKADLLKEHRNVLKPSKN